MDLNILHEIDVASIIVIPTFYLKNTLPSYLQEKGKNLATKEDIGEITKTVEGIKTSFILEIEKVKVNLSFLNTSRISLANEERLAIINYYEKHYAWFTLC